MWTGVHSPTEVTNGGHSKFLAQFEDVIVSINDGWIRYNINAKAAAADPVLAEVLGQALKHVDRKLVQVSLMLGAGDGRRGSDRDFSAEGITSAIDKALHASGLGWFDLAILDEPGDDDALVVVGALHLLGEDGLVELLEAEGYTVERL